MSGRVLNSHFFFVFDGAGADDGETDLFLCDINTCKYDGECMRIGDSITCICNFKVRQQLYSLVFVAAHLLGLTTLTLFTQKNEYLSYNDWIRWRQTQLSTIYAKLLTVCPLDLESDREPVSYRGVVLGAGLVTGHPRGGEGLGLDTPEEGKVSGLTLSVPWLVQQPTSLMAWPWTEL